MTVFTTATVASDQTGYFLIQQPINEGKNRKTKSVGRWYQQNPYPHDDKTDDLVKILIDIKLSA